MQFVTYDHIKQFTSSRGFNVADISIGFLIETIAPIGTAIDIATTPDEIQQWVGQLGSINEVTEEHPEGTIVDLLAELSNSTGVDQSKQMVIEFFLTKLFDGATDDEDGFNGRLYLPWNIVGHNPETPVGMLLGLKRADERVKNSLYPEDQDSGRQLIRADIALPVDFVVEGQNVSHSLQQDYANGIALFAGFSGVDFKMSMYGYHYPTAEELIPDYQDLNGDPEFIVVFKNGIKLALTVLIIEGMNTGAYWAGQTLSDVIKEVITFDGVREF